MVIFIFMTMYFKRWESGTRKGRAAVVGRGNSRRFLF